MPAAVSLSGEEREQPVGSGEVTGHFAVPFSRARSRTSGEGTEVAQQVRLIEIAGGKRGLDSCPALRVADFDQGRLQADDAGIQLGPDSQAGGKGSLELAPRNGESVSDLVDAHPAAAGEDQGDRAGASRRGLCWRSADNLGEPGGRRRGARREVARDQEAGPTSRASESSRSTAQGMSTVKSPGRAPGRKRMPKVSTTRPARRLQGRDSVPARKALPWRRQAFSTRRENGSPRCTMSSGQPSGTMCSAGRSKRGTLSTACQQHSSNSRHCSGGGSSS